MSSPGDATRHLIPGGKNVKDIESQNVHASFRKWMLPMYVFLILMSVLLVLTLRNSVSVFSIILPSLLLPRLRPIPTREKRYLRRNLISSRRVVCIPSVVAMLVDGFRKNNSCLTAASMCLMNISKK